MKPDPKSSPWSRPGDQRDPGDETPEGAGAPVADVSAVARAADECHATLKASGAENWIIIAVPPEDHEGAVHSEVCICGRDVDLGRAAFMAVTQIKDLKRGFAIAALQSGDFDVETTSRDR